MSYETRVETLGYLEEEEVRVVDVPRRDFLDLVESVLEDYSHSDAVREKLLPVARTMPRFPLGQWMDEVRGCGCIVGEYLVAAEIIGRGDDNAAVALDDDDLVDGDELFTFGLAVDRRLRRVLDEHLAKGTWDGYDRDYEGRDVLAVFIDEEATS